MIFLVFYHYVLYFTDLKLPAVDVNVTEGRDSLWAKTKRAFVYMYENYRDEADWFLKVK